MAGTVTLTVDEDKAAALNGLLALLAGNQGAPQATVAEPTTAAKPTKAPAKKAEPEVAPQDALIEKLGLRYGKGSTVLSAEGIKAAARVLKSGTPEAIAKEEGNGSHVILFRTDKGNLRIQNAFTPKA